MNKSFFWLIVFSLFALASCVPNKKIVYLQDLTLSKKDTTVEFKLDRQEYQFKPGDFLYIDVRTSDTRAMTYFSNSSSTNIGQMANINGDLYFALGNGIDKDGNIDFPYIGKLKISGKNVFEAQAFITEKLKEYLVNVIVTVRWGGIRFSVLGEVRNPGKYLILQNQLTILEALAQASDFTDFAKRSEVLIIRETSEGVKTFKLNLLDSSALTSPGFYIQPDDIIYVQPLKARMFTSLLGSQYLQVITTLLTTLVLINSLTR